ncbi:hypothetical protein CLM85_04660 [Streptomyces albidoflavus]|nr:hypothetical protein CLM83_05550 [Streptomyces albidoflavus]PBO25387.1 hypothetical protein CLM85_04660 [Streptomyces albidoflavus]PBO29737.1 hypothetical protein CLM84_12505 [Streptomyces albidoflavus]
MQSGGLVWGVGGVGDEVGDGGEVKQHGTWLVIMCYGDDGFHGRGIAHPAVFNVPYAAWIHR